MRIKRPSKRVMLVIIAVLITAVGLCLSLALLRKEPPKTADNTNQNSEQAAAEKVFKGYQTVELDESADQILFNNARQKFNSGEYATAYELAVEYIDKYIEVSETSTLSMFQQGMLSAQKLGQTDKLDSVYGNAKKFLVNVKNTDTRQHWTKYLEDLYAGKQQQDAEGGNEVQ